VRSFFHSAHTKTLKANVYSDRSYYLLKSETGNALAVNVENITSVFTPRSFQRTFSMFKHCKALVCLVLYLVWEEELMPDIFNYTDYRKFLYDWFEEKKKDNPSVSFRMIAGKVGYKAPSYLPSLLACKVNSHLQCVLNSVPQ
jgi:hypothetical protein